MRPGQQNRRMRGRGGGRKGPNPLTRSYESNGPDVKIRGSAQQVADKYAALARDAMSAGDRVMAENYLQHAEHYNRIIATAQAQAAQQREQRDDDDDSDTQDAQAKQKREETAADAASGPQPVIDGIPAEVSMEQEGAQSNGERQRRARRDAAPNGAEGEAAAEAAEAGETADAAAGDDGKRPRRGRPRRPRSETADGEAAETGGDDSGNDELPAFIQG